MTFVTLKTYCLFLYFGLKNLVNNCRPYFCRPVGYGSQSKMTMILAITPVIRNLCTTSRAVSLEYRDLLKRSRDLLAEKIQSGIYVDPFEGNNVMKMLIKTDQLHDARYLFDKMPARDEISWTTIISGYVNASNALEALILFSTMWVDPDIRVDQFILSLALKACGGHCALKLGESIHGYSFKTGIVSSVFVGSSLLDMYTKAGSVAIARRVFDEMPVKNVVSWTAIITGLVHAGHTKEALANFSAMWLSDVQCDSYTFASVSKACADLGALRHGKAIHSQAIKLGFDTSSFVANTLAYMYNKCGKLDYGLHLFESMRIRDVVSWTTIITTYVQLGSEEKAVEAFVRMRESGVTPNDFTFATVISASAGLVKGEWGQQLHAHVFRLGFARSMSVANAIMTMYAKCGFLPSASMVFHDMIKRDVISWSAIIAGYCQEGQGEEAFSLFSQMRMEGPRPNEFTLASLLSVCAFMAILEQGKQIHAHILSIGVEHDPMINSALITMYSKCGSIGEAKEIFDTGNDDIVSWTTMINGFAEHGHSREAIDLFEEMSNVGLRPDYVTFIGVLSACSHAGLVDLGFHYFNSMSSKYHINLGKEHYGCMVDLLARAGKLSEAESMIKRMPFTPDDVVWSTLLRACRVHGDTELARQTAEHILKMDPNCAGTHITLSNVYAATGMWTDAADVRKLMKSKGVRKEPGWSWIKVKDKVSTFVAGEKSHPQGEKLCEMLNLVASSAKTDVVLETSSLLLDFED